MSHSLARKWSMLIMKSEIFEYLLDYLVKLWGGRERARIYMQLWVNLWLICFVGGRHFPRRQVTVGTSMALFFFFNFLLFLEWSCQIFLI